jgi:hypothetical protein
MTQTISFQFTPAKEDYIRAARTIQMSNKRLWPILVAMVLLELCALSAILGGRLGGSPLNWMFVLPLPLVVLYIFVWGPINLGRQIEKNERFTCEVTWQADDSQILVKNKFSETKMDWGTFQRFIETKDCYYLVYTVNKQMSQFVPKRAFKSKEHEAAFREMLKRNIKAIWKQNSHSQGYASDIIVEKE